jgi:hypothetical protein
MESAQGIPFFRREIRFHMGYFSLDSFAGTDKSAWSVYYVEPLELSRKKISLSFSIRRVNPGDHEK